MSMRTLNEGSKINPKITFDEDKLEMRVEGWSLSERPMQVYYECMEMAATLRNSVSKPIRLVIHLQCFNTASSKCLMDLAVLISDTRTYIGIPGEIVWCYNSDDPEAKEWGEDIEAGAGVSFSYLEVVQS